MAEIDVVAEEEDDDVLRLFSHQREHTLEARRFWAEQVGTKEAMMTAQELEEYQEIAQHFLDLMSPENRLIGLAPEQMERALGILAPEQRVAGLAPEQMERAFGSLSPEQRVAGLAPEQRVAGLGPEQLVAVIPEEVLQVLSDELIEQLPEPTRSAVRARRGR